MILNNLLNFYPEEELFSLLNEIKEKSVNLIKQLINVTTHKIFEDFNSFSF